MFYYINLSTKPMVRNKSSCSFSTGSAFEVIIKWIFLSGTPKNPRNDIKKSFTKVGAKIPDLLRTTHGLRRNPAVQIASSGQNSILFFKRERY